MSDSVRTLNGITFSTNEEYLRAKKELEGIRYVKENNDMSNDQTVLALYNKFVNKSVFRTQIGYEFLKELQERLMRSDSIDKSQVAKLPISDFSDDEPASHQITKPEKRMAERSAYNIATKKPATVQTAPTPKKKPVMFLEAEQKERKHTELEQVRSKYRWSMFWNILLVVVIIMMAYITLNGNHVNIINYESKLLDKYASWAQELLEKEEELNRLERELKSLLPD